ncbi:MAG: N-acetylmuramoyl-L-alanine amidase [Lachnospiraceae bacterium]|nr:N-acetylmuramoyl-L-alanine amidase [Lachnospiraceae bacterium]
MTVVLISGMFGAEEQVQAAAASYKFVYKEYVQNTKVKYNGTVPNYTIDGVKIDLNDTPGIVNSQNYAMCNAEAVFGAAGVKVKYSASKQQISFKYLGNKLILFLNTDKAEFNGEEIKSPCVSYKVKYYDNGEKTILVPSRFVAETLHIGYTWNESIKTAELVTPIKIKYNGETHYYAGSRGALNVDGEPVDNSEYPSLIFSDNALLALETAFEELDDVYFDYDRKSGIFEVECGDINIRMITGSTCSYVNGLLETCPVSPMRIKNYDTGTTDLYFPGRYVFETLGFDYSWDSKTRTSVIKTVDGKTGIFSKKYEIVSVADAEPVLDQADITDTPDYRQELILPLPEGVDPAGVDVKDLLYENKICYEISGDHRSFYTDNSLINTGEAVLQASVLYYAGEDLTRITLCTRTDESGVILGHRDKSGDGRIVITLDRPHNLYDKVIILDAGHGGSDPGTQHGGYDEKDMNFAVIYKYCKEYFDDSDIKVYYSRYDDTLPSLYTRAGLAVRIGADLFISVHHNSNNNKSITGTSVYYSTEDTGVFPTPVSDTEHKGSENEGTETDVSDREEPDTEDHDTETGLENDKNEREYDNSDMSDPNKEAVVENDGNMPQSDSLLTPDTDTETAGEYDEEAHETDNWESGNTDIASDDDHENAETDLDEEKDTHDITSQNTATGSEGNTSSENVLTGKIMAQMMLDALISKLKTVDRGVIDRNFVVVGKNNTVPAVLIEIGFMSSPDELKRIVKPAFQKKAAKAIFTTVKEIYALYGSGTSATK